MNNWTRIRGQTDSPVVHAILHIHVFDVTRTILSNGPRCHCGYPIAVGVVYESSFTFFTCNGLFFVIFRTETPLSLDRII